MILYLKIFDKIRSICLDIGKFVRVLQYLYKPVSIFNVSSNIDYPWLKNITNRGPSEEKLRHYSHLFSIFILIIQPHISQVLNRADSSLPGFQRQIEIFIRYSFIR